jgi:hypothetical protein
MVTELVNGKSGLLVAEFSGRASVHALQKLIREAGDRSGMYYIIRAELIMLSNILE